MSIKGQSHSLTLIKGHSDFKVKCLSFGLHTQVSDSGPLGPLVYRLVVYRSLHKIPIKIHCLARLSIFGGLSKKERIYFLSSQLFTKVCKRFPLKYTVSLVSVFLVDYPKKRGSIFYRLSCLQRFASNSHYNTLSDSSRYFG